VTSVIEKTEGIVLTALFLRQAMDRILARPDLACLGKRSRKKSHTSPSTSSQPELSSSKQREVCNSCEFPYINIKTISNEQSPH